MKLKQLVVYNGSIFYIKHISINLMTVTSITDYSNIIIGINIPLVTSYDIHDMWTTVGTDPIAISNYLRTKHPEYFI